MAQYKTVNDLIQIVRGQAQEWGVELVNGYAGDLATDGTGLYADALSLLSLFNDAQEDLIEVGFNRCYRTVALPYQPLTFNAGEFFLPGDMTSIASCFLTDANVPVNTRRELILTNIGQLDATQPYWRRAGLGVPRYIYFDNGGFGVWPRVQRTGYSVVLFGDVAPTPLALPTDIPFAKYNNADPPALVTSRLPYIYHTLLSDYALWKIAEARENNPTDAAKRERNYRERKAKLQAEIQDRHLYGETRTSVNRGLEYPTGLRVV